MAVKEYLMCLEPIFSRYFLHEKMEALKSFTLIKLMVPVHSNNLKIERIFSLPHHTKILDPCPGIDMVPPVFG